MKKLVTSLVLALGFTAAQAQLTGNVGLTNDFRFRGISQTQGDTALQGGMDYADTNGLYVGNWNSTVSSQAYTNSNGLMSNVYGGYKQRLGVFTVDAGLSSYFFSGAKPYNTDELYIGAAVGTLSARISHVYSGEYFGTADARGTKYYELNFKQPVGKGLALVAHAGRTDVANQTNGDHNDFNAGVVATVAGLDFAAKYHVNGGMNDAFKTANTIGGEKNYDKGFVLSVGKRF